MATEWFNAGFQGVRYKKHPTRKKGIQFDKYFAIYYQLNGKRKEEGVGWATRGFTAAGAYDLLNELKQNHKSGEGPQTLAEKRKLEEHAREQARLKEKAEALSLDDYWPTYYEHAKRIKKLSSAEKEESHFRKWLSPTLGKVPIRGIDVLQWDLLVETLTAARKSLRTLEYVTGTLRRVLKHAYHRGLVTMPPPSGKRIGVTGPGSSNRRLRVISKKEAQAILSKLKTTDSHAWRITRFAFLTGARASECFNLKWRDIDRSRMVLIFPETKNRDVRHLKLTPPINDLLKKITEGPLDEPVFLRKDGKPYKEAPPAFRAAVADLKLNNGRSKREKISFHNIRHTVATELAKTLNLRDLMDVMGWRTVEMAMRYVHANEDKKASALASLHDTMLAEQEENGGNVIPFKGKAK
ncbi:MAG: site-specific integrase [Desulfobacteraceae bacterium]|nr:site-specific integrase [Desulfobacteraceae bacterium]MBC2748840.1 site-specific integrase [Desulfobacteraceae bacterium]